MRRRGGRTSHEEHDRSSSRQARSAATDGAPPAARGRRPIRRRRFGFEAMDRPRLEGDRQDVDPPGCVGATSPNVHPVVACSAMDGRTPRCLSGSGRPDRGMRASPAWDRSPPFLRRGCGDCRAADRSPSRRRPDACRQAPGLVFISDVGTVDRIRSPRRQGEWCPRPAEWTRGRSTRSARRPPGDGPRPLAGTRRRSARGHP
jgi:hypothetical protein